MDTADSGEMQHPEQTPAANTGPMAGEEEDTAYIGFDFSTQQLKALAIDCHLKVICEASVMFDRELPEFRTHGGVNAGADGLTFTAPAIMWVKALDMLMDKLRVAGLDFARVAALSGAGQQHGCVLWRAGAEATLGSLEPDQFLHQQLESAFSVRNSPIWMDSSTTAQCRALEQYVGGPQKLADITGSRAYERFTGNQIAKIHQQSPEAYKNTERISLVSSFGASLFLCKYAGIDLSDGSGMNLLDIGKHAWDQHCLDACAPGLGSRLGAPVPDAGRLLGPIGEFWAERYGFRPDCGVVAFTGDNPASLAGLRLRPGDLALSLGTSDTVFACLERPRPALTGHVFVSPTDADKYMALLCFKNGSLTRQKYRDQCAGGSWDTFNQLLSTAPPGNLGSIGVYWLEQEITPHGSGVHRRDASGAAVEAFDKHTEVRAVVEGQLMAKRVHAESLGFQLGEESRVLVTGGASRNPALRQVVADVFNAPVYTHDVANSACLGAAYLARLGRCRSAAAAAGDTDAVTFDTVTAAAEPFHLACQPRPDAQQVYGPLLERYRALEAELVAEQ
ncbi:xylulose kinase-like isoform X2 [Amphibalanus amphitrite]|uniref:xylulose kinase-like isoform X2 n=1 Tax=Amphibalanus amphitrite TaxID=1232801 RepID=UPI001C921AF1|nr:xylulose kinase-like isoform X2 [Amphibalanus amphitrite]